MMSEVKTDRLLSLEAKVYSARRRLFEEAKVASQGIFSLGKGVVQDVGEELSIREHTRKHPWKWMGASFLIGATVAQLGSRENKSSSTIGAESRKRSPFSITSLLQDVALASAVELGDHFKTGVLSFLKNALTTDRPKTTSVEPSSPVSIFSSPRTQGTGNRFPDFLD